MIIEQSTFIFLVWIILLILWYASESKGMTILMTMMFVPLTFVFIVYSIPLIISTDAVLLSIVQIIFMCIGLAVLGFTIDEYGRHK